MLIVLLALTNYREKKFVTIKEHGIYTYSCGVRSSWWGIVITHWADGRPGRQADAWLWLLEKVAM